MTVLQAYIAALLILSVNLLTLWVMSGIARIKAGMANNPEDGVHYKMPASETDPPAVARCLRAHRNAEATIYPFLLVGLVYVMAGGRVLIAAPIFAIFVLARLVHSVAYLRALQPWRTYAFQASLLAILALMVATAGASLG